MTQGTHLLQLWQELALARALEIVSRLQVLDLGQQLLFQPLLLGHGLRQQAHLAFQLVILLLPPLPEK